MVARIIKDKSGYKIEYSDGSNEYFARKEPLDNRIQELKEEGITIVNDHV